MNSWRSWKLELAGLETHDEGFFGGFLAGDEKTLRQSLDRIPAAVEGLEDEAERRAWNVFSVTASLKHSGQA